MKGFSKHLLLVTLSAMTLTACQVPSSVKMTASTSPLPGKDLPEPFRPLIVGLEAPTWESQEKQINYFGWDRKIDNTYTRIKTSEKVVAITFDDGPHGQNTPRLLDMLKKRNIKATFYVVGNMVTYNPQILRRMISEGHEIGNHTVSHGNLARMSNSALKKELQKAHDQILQETGIAPRTMRPPGGAITRNQKQFMLEEFGYPTILWSVDPLDWKKPGPSVVTRRLLDGAAPGGILLVHDLHKATVDAMPATLDGLLQRGYRFVTVTELIAMDESGKELEKEKGEGTETASD